MSAAEDRRRSTNTSPVTGENRGPTPKNRLTSTTKDNSLPQAFRAVRGTTIQPGLGSTNTPDKPAEITTFSTSNQHLPSVDSTNNDIDSDSNSNSNSNSNNNNNVKEVEAMSAKGVDPKIPLYKPDPAVQQAKSGGSPWGTKPGVMFNGKDFFVELRKQVTALQQTGGVSQGG